MPDKKIRIVILTSLRKGSASYCLNELVKSDQIEILGVVFSHQMVKNSKPLIKRKLAKIIRIGLAGAINGFRMRKWFGEMVQVKLAIQEIGDVCREFNISYKEVDLINSDDCRVYLKSLRPDIGVSLGNSYIAPSVFKIPINGMINIHGEILPAFQNAQSVIWQIYEGSSNTGFTIHKIDKSIDTGEILFQQIIPIKFGSNLKETVVESCAQILANASLALRRILENYHEFANASVPQGQGQHYTTPTIWQYYKMVRQHTLLRLINKN